MGHPAPRTPFKFAPGVLTHTVTIDGATHALRAPWFIATDVCKALGIDTDNVRRTVDADEVNSVKLAGFRGVPPLIVSESGMYALTMRRAVAR